MSTQKSFSSLENELRHAFRDHLNHAESMHDVDNAFRQVAKALLFNAFNGELKFNDEDIRFTPDQEPGYSFADNITLAEPFQTLRQSSDLDAILGRFSEAACHRYKSMHGNGERFLARTPSNH